MSERTTNADLHIMLARYVRACEALELIPDGHRVGLDYGSKTYGRAFRVYMSPPGSYAHHRPPAGRDYLGMTKREAFDTLADRAAALEDVAYAQERNR